MVQFSLVARVSTYRLTPLHGELHPHSMRQHPQAHPVTCAQPPSGPAPEFLKRSGSRLGVAMQYDVIMCGGTLGIFLATALQLAGHRCAMLAW